MSKPRLSDALSEEKAVKPSSSDEVISAVQIAPDDAVDAAEKGLGATLADSPAIDKKGDSLQRTVTAQDWYVFLEPIFPP